MGELWCCNEENKLSTHDSDEDSTTDEESDEEEKEGGEIITVVEKSPLKSLDAVVDTVGDPEYSDSESEEEEEEDDEQEDNEVKSLIQSTTKYLTTEDYNELIHLLQDIENEADPVILNSVAELKKLIDKYLVING